ncbi:enhanced intracellular survival protein Eis [Paenactinomyces guangxiensis]|uniref:GNAT family N-acetyltransferase n=1 Tax=Paenactinomyces guangxiensis TaxID=1490290 RepID=A0A7W1WQI0_9BACL|nr:GNAT family N-acetyltransferase [Paenactinomyces guangxiensis]MBA4494200.1 GNAT family N-acetyltransferase [Paenactinomyces guangxiensis]MBH8590696.1 GNAT family N-acetyltransferase [Paenactinomyces guangxiensis]
MSFIKKIPVEDVKHFVPLVANAYPGLNMSEEKVREAFLKTQTEDLFSDFYGYYRGNQLLGCMKIYDFSMNLYGTKVLAGGLGTVAVHLLHKKEKIAKELVTFFLQYCREKGACLALLYPFRPDFYKKMGFGYGTKVNQYRVLPDCLPRGKSKENVFFVTEAEKENLLACYRRFMEKTHGMIDKTQGELDALFENKRHWIAAFKQDGQIRGYLVLEAQSAHEENRFFNDLHVKEMIYESPESLSELLTFLHSQLDQFQRIVFNTQDEDFYHLLTDPRNGSNRMIPSLFHESYVSGVGLMYRVINLKNLFSQLTLRRFGNQSCTVNFKIRDSFLPENEKSCVVSFRDGFPRVMDHSEAEVEVDLDISDFSSLMMGSVSFKSLVGYGLVKLSDPACLSRLEQIFSKQEKPVCTTTF